MPFLILILIPFILFAQTAQLLKVESENTLHFLVEDDIEIVCHLRAIKPYNSFSHCKHSKKFSKIATQYLGQIMPLNKRYFLEETAYIKDNVYHCSIAGSVKDYTQKLLQEGYALYDQKSDLRHVHETYYQTAKEKKIGLWGRYPQEMECYEK